MRRTLLVISAVVATSAALLTVVGAGSSPAPAAGSQRSALNRQMSTFLHRVVPSFFLTIPRRSTVPRRAIPVPKSLSGGTACPAATAGAGSAPCPRIPCVQFIGQAPVAPSVPVIGTLGSTIARAASALNCARAPAFNRAIPIGTVPLRASRP